MANKIARLLAPALMVSALAFTTAQPAFAADPDIILPAGLGCDFELGITSSGGNLHTKEFTDKNGNVVRFLTAGKGVDITYTNLETGQEVTVRTPGSVTSTRVNPDGTLTVTATGHNGLILFPSDVPAGPTTTHYTGRIVYTIDPTTGVFTLVSTSGPQRNICAELSS